MVTFNNGGIQRKHLKLPGSFCTPYQSKNGTPVKNLIIAIICKSTRNWRMFVTLQKMASLLIWTHFRMVVLTVCTQKIPLIDLDISARDSAIFFSNIHVIFASFIYELGHQRISAPYWKPEEIWLRIFLWSYESIPDIVDLIGSLHVFQFS